MKEDDEALMLAKVLLGGYLDHDKHGLLHKKYLTDETQARRSIASLLRSESPLDPDLRDKLAALFDPAPDTHGAIDRKLIFAHRGRGARKKLERTSSIAWHVWGLVTRGLTADAAIQSAAGQFEVDERNVKKMWAKHRPVFEATWGPPVPPSGAKKGR